VALGWGLWEVPARFFCALPLLLTAPTLKSCLTPNRISVEFREFQPDSEKVESTLQRRA